METHGVWEDSAKVLSSSRVNILISPPSQKVSFEGSPVKDYCGAAGLMWLNYLKFRLGRAKKPLNPV
jgi:hypothetical protein